MYTQSIVLRSLTTTLVSFPCPSLPPLPWPQVSTLPSAVRRTLWNLHNSTYIEREGGGEREGRKGGGKEVYREGGMVGQGRRGEGERRRGKRR